MVGQAIVFYLTTHLADTVADTEPAIYRQLRLVTSRLLGIGDCRTTTISLDNRLCKDGRQYG